MPTRSSNRQNRHPTGVALAGFVALVAAMGIGRFVYTPLLPMMRAEGILAVETGGLLASTNFIGYAAGAILVRFVPARLTSLTVFLSMAVLGLTMLAMGLTSNPAIWAMARFVAGICSAFVLVRVSTDVMGRLVELGRGDLSGLVFSGVGAGIALSGLLALGLLALGGSSSAGWIVSGAFTCIAAFASPAGATAASQRNRADGREPGPSRGTLQWRIVIPYGAMGLGYVIPATYLPLMASDMTSSLAFGWVWPAFGLAAMLSTLIASRLAGNATDRSIWLACQIIMAFGVVLPAFWASLVTIAIAGICVGATFMVITMAGMKEARRISQGDAEVQIAAMTAAFALGQIAGPAIAGWIYGLTGAFDSVLILASAALVLTALLLLDRSKRSEEKAAM